MERKGEYLGVCLRDRGVVSHLENARHRSLFN